MGTWGAQGFDNDTAADWAADIGEQGVADLVKVLNEPLEDGDIDTAQIVYAAAELVAAAFGHPAQSTPNYAEDALERAAEIRALEGIVPLALKALDALEAPGSELLEEWEDDGEEIRRELADLRRRLSGIQTKT